jgi:hypothetical protein
MQTTITACRSCGAAFLREILDFGNSPLADVLIDEEDLAREDLRYPLKLVFCPACELVQITENVPPEILYGGNYPYYTSVNRTMVEHFTKSAEAILVRHPLDANSLVIEAASNDGCMLSPSTPAASRLGIDREGPVDAANAEDRFAVPLLRRGVARNSSHGKRADVILGNNV